MSDPKKQLDAAKELINKNLPEVADEIHEWNNTALLRDGKLREAAYLLSDKTFEHRELQMVEDMAYKLMTQHFSELYRENKAYSAISISFTCSTAATAKTDNKET